MYVKYKISVRKNMHVTYKKTEIYFEKFCGIPFQSESVHNKVGHDTDLTKYTTIYLER